MTTLATEGVPPVQDTGGYLHEIRSFDVAVKVEEVDDASVEAQPCLMQCAPSVVEPQESMSQLLDVGTLPGANYYG